MPTRLLASALVDPVARHTTCAWADGHGIVGIDPGFEEERSGVALVPLVLSAVRARDA